MRSLPILLVIPLVASALLAPRPVPAAPPPEAPFAYAELEALLGDPKDPIRSPDDLLRRLPESLRANFTLGYSPHNFRADAGVDADHPRIILFSDDGKLLIALNGAGPQAGVVDIIRYDDAGRAFSPVRWTFGASPPVGTSTVAVDRQPTDCLECHRSAGGRFIPIYNPYPDWRGFFGSGDDRFKDARDPERLAYVKFRSAAASLPVYRRLRFGSAAPDAPFGTRAAEARRSIAQRPNQRLTMLLTRLTTRGMPRHELATPYFARYRSYLLAELIGCDFRIAPGLGSAFSTRLALDLKQAGIRPLSASPLKSLGELLNFGLYNYEGSAASFRGSVTDLDFRDGSTTVGKLLAAELMRDLVQERRANGQDLSAHYQLAPYDYANAGVDSALGAINATGSELDVRRAKGACPALLKLADAELKAAPPATACLDCRDRLDPTSVERSRISSLAADVARVADNPFARCVSCHAHADGRPGPPIPFDDPARLLARLRADPGLRSRILDRIETSSRERVMPMLPVPALTGRERRDVRKFLDAAR